MNFALFNFSPDLTRIIKLLEQFMSLATDKLNVIETKVDAVVVIVAELKAKLSEVLTPEEVAKFDAIISKLEAVTAPEPTPEVPVEPVA